MKHYTKLIASTAAALIFSAGIAAAQSDTAAKTATKEKATAEKTSADNTTMENKPDDSFVSISGTVASAAADSFQLDYGEGLITVEMDDWDWYPEAAGLLGGDNVTVYGVIDDDMLETKSIEATSVFVKGLNTYFYASGSDEEDVVYNAITEPRLAARIDVTGTVESINGREFTIDIGSRDLTVDTSGMTYNPLDDEGFQMVDVDDRVKVTGSMDYALFEANEVNATSVITLAEDVKKSSS
ncbi:hypothetical protein [Hoeflea sp.]|uniref:hypothetical protein n=1 Tax=Hoeflea sp. TaxID=1940281 RepID=UPI003A9318CA